MKLLCLECATPLRPEDINPAADVARWPSCGAVFPARQLLRRYSPFDKRRPPMGSGIELRLDADGFGEVVLPRGPRHPVALVMSGAVAVWIVWITVVLGPAALDSIGILLFAVVCWAAGGVLAWICTHLLLEKQCLAFGPTALEHRAGIFSYRGRRTIPYAAISGVTSEYQLAGWDARSVSVASNAVPLSSPALPRLLLAGRSEYLGTCLRPGNAHWLAALVRDLVRAHQRRPGIVVQPPAKRGK